MKNNAGSEKHLGEDVMNISKLERKCPICGESKGESMYHISMMLPQTFPIQGDYDVIACSKCGFIYADVSGTQENYNEYYENIICTVLLLHSKRIHMIPHAVIE